MLFPGAGRVDGSLCDIAHSGDLYAVIPCRGAFHCQAATDIDAAAASCFPVSIMVYSTFLAPPRRAVLFS